MEDFLLDAMAWTIAISLWCLPKMDYGAGERLGDGDGTDVDGRLEYREDYGPSVSPWPSAPASGTERGKASSKNSNEEQ
jgi:hypothetical protein